MKENGLSSIVAVDAVDGWPYRIMLSESEGKYNIGANLIVCDYDDKSQKYTLIDCSDYNKYVTKVRSLPCSTVLVAKSSVEESMSYFLNGLGTDYYKIDKVTAKRRTDNVGDGSGLTYDDLNVTVWVPDE